MTVNQNHANLNVFVYGDQDVDQSFHASEIHPRGGYGVLGIPGEVCDLTLFIHTPEQARAIAAAAAEIAAQFPGAEPEPEPLDPAATVADIVGCRVIGADDDSPCPSVGTITAITADPEFVMVTWLPADGALPAVTVRMALDELTPADRGRPEPAHECGTPAEGTPDLNTYPARMIVSQRDPADPESWVFRCGEQHASGAPGWQSPDYASQDDALIAAGDHARAMHDMGLPAELAELAAAAERAFSGQ